MSRDPNYQNAQRVIQNALSEAETYLHELDAFTTIDGYEFSPTEFICHRDVWTPKYSSSGIFLTRHMPMEGTLLDLGCGMGLIGMYNALRGIKVTQADKSLKATEITQRNAIKHRLTNLVQVIQSDLYENIIGNFDRIVWNCPNYPIKPNQDIELESAIFDEDFKISRSAIFGATDHLNQGGILFVGFSDNANITPLLKIIEDTKLQVVKIDSESAGNYTRYMYSLKNY